MPPGLPGDAGQLPLDRFGRHVVGLCIPKGSERPNQLSARICDRLGRGDVLRQESISEHAERQLDWAKDNAEGRTFEVMLVLNGCALTLVAV